MRGNLVGDDTSLDVIAIGESKMLLWRDVAKHCSSKGSNICSTDGGGDVIVSGCDIGGKRTQSVKWRLAAPIQLVAHVFGNLVKRYMAGSLIHDLDIFFPGTTGESTLSLEFGKLGFIISVVNGSGTKTISDGESNVVLGANIKNLIPMIIRKVLLVVENAPLGMNGSSTADDTSHSFNSHWNIMEQHSSMNGEVIDTLLCLFDQSLTENLPGQIFRDTIDLFQGLVDWYCSDRNGAVSHNPFSCFVDMLSCRQIH
mmetsp:Transcript_18421/g.40109  ORF Transcript_18421/g.40109 Transcript_18421/m.40109 type:complete len:256 (+) Transcript_18421:667-1434(+)